MKEREKLFNEIKEDIETLIDTINSFEKIRLLGALGSVLFEDIKHTRPKLPNILETSVEYALSIALSSPNNRMAIIPSAESMLDVLAKLEKVREKYMEYIVSEVNTSKYEISQQLLRKSVIENTLTVRGDNYKIHIEEVFLELFKEHIDFFLENYGFDPQTILETVYYIEDGIYTNQVIVKEEHKKFLNWSSGLKEEDRIRHRMIYGNRTGDPFLLSEIYQRDTGIETRFKSVDEKFKFIDDEISPRQKRVIEQLSLRFGDNEEFLNPKFKALPLNDSLVSSKPILYDDINCSYYCFSTKILHKNLFNIAEGLIKRADRGYFDNIYLGKGIKARSTYFENKVAELMSKIIPNHSIHTNLKYKIGEDEYEIDVLIETGNHIYLVEVKSGLYSNEARRGGVDSLTTDLSTLVGYSAAQVSRTENYIKNQEHLFYAKKRNPFTVDINKSIIKITVSFDSITGVTNQLYSLKELSILQDNNTFPLSISIFNLIVIADVFGNNEQEFLNYIEARLPLYKEENFIIKDELDFLGLYLSRDFRKTIKKFEREKKIILSSNYRSKLDNYCVGLL